MHNEVNQQRGTIIKKILTSVMGALALTAGLAVGVAPAANAVTNDANGDGVNDRFQSVGWWDTPVSSATTDEARWTYENYPFACNPDNSAGPTWEVLSVYPIGGTSGTATTAGKNAVREMLARTNSILSASAQQVMTNASSVYTARSARYRTFTNADGECFPIIRDVAIPADKFPRGGTISEGSTNGDAEVSFFDYVSYMKGIGYNVEDEKYISLLSNPYRVPFSGVSQLPQSSTVTGPTNRANYTSHLAIQFTNGSDPYSNAWIRSRTLAHEMVHSLGGVAYDMPHKNPNNGSHAADCWDIMCYAFTGTAGQTYANGCGGQNSPGRFYYRLDCNDDDYFNSMSPATGYLSNHWNIFNAASLWGGTAPAYGTVTARQATEDTLPIIYD